jgi:hypothetical protein
MEAWSAWVQLAAMRELARRRPAIEPGDTGRAGFSDFAADELMGQFHLTWEAATGQIVYACAVADRLPRTFAALQAGQIHPVAVKIVEDETGYLSPEHATQADQVLADLWNRDVLQLPWPSPSCRCQRPIRWGQNIFANDLGGAGRTWNGGAETSW